MVRTSNRETPLVDVGPGTRGSVLRICCSTASTFDEATSMVTSSASRAIGATRCIRAVECVGQPKQRLGVGKLERLRHHADDGEGLAVHGEAASEDVGLATEVLLPHRITEDDDWLGRRRFFRGEEDAPERRSSTKHLEDRG